MDFLKNSTRVTKQIVKHLNMYFIQKNHVEKELDKICLSITVMNLVFLKLFNPSSMTIFYNKILVNTAFITFQYF